MFKLKPFTILAFCAGILAFQSCKKDNNDYDVPTTYNFTNVSYSGQTERLDMLAELETYMKTSNTSGTAVEAATMKAMYANDGHTWTESALNSSTKDLKSKSFEIAQAEIEASMDALAAASQSTTAGSKGTAGVVESNDGAKAYLFDENGIEHTQLIAKGIMGACLYYQMTSVYTGTDKMNVDNETVEEGKGTEMEHHWDEAFGYYGAPIDFTNATTTGYRYWAKYSFKGDADHDLINKVMTAFIKGRAAISNDDLDTRDAQITELRAQLEMVSVTTAIYYLESAKADLADDALRNHQLSEAHAFIKALEYNVDKTISSAQITTVLGHLGTNFYDVSASNIDAAVAELKTIYGIQ